MAEAPGDDSSLYLQELRQTILQQSMMSEQAMDEEYKLYLEELRQSILKHSMMPEQAMDEVNERYLKTLKKFLDPPTSMETWKIVRPFPLPDTISDLMFYPGEIKNRVSDESEAVLKDPLNLLIEEKLKSKLKEKYGDVPLKQLAEAHEHVFFNAGDDMEAYGMKKVDHDDPVTDFSKLSCV